MRYFPNSCLLKTLVMNESGVQNMENLLSVAGILFQRYLKENGVMMTEMKLHKLMYFVQRESFVKNERPLFEGHFHAWKYGPVLKEIRDIYLKENFQLLGNLELKEKDSDALISNIYNAFANKDPWSLSSLTHLEYSWKNARKGLSSEAACDVVMKNEDIMIDAMRVRERRFFANL